MGSEASSLTALPAGIGPVTITFYSNILYNYQLLFLLQNHLNNWRFNVKFEFVRNKGILPFGGECAESAFELGPFKMMCLVHLHVTQIITFIRAMIAHPVPTKGLLSCRCSRSSHFDGKVLMKSGQGITN